MFLDNETYKKLLEMVKNNRRKMLKQKLSKEERSEIAKKAWTPERKQKRSDYMKARWENNDVHLGYRHTEEAKQKMSDSRKGKPGRKWTNEQRKSLSDKKKGKVVGKNVKDYMTPEKYELYRQHLSDSLKGHEVSEETRQKIREKTAARGDFINGANPKAKKMHRYS